MNAIKNALDPLTRWLPPEVRNFLDAGGWWLVLAALALLVLLLLWWLLRRIRRALFGRKKAEQDWEYCLDEDLTDFPLPVTPPEDYRVTVYQVPALLRLVILAPAGSGQRIEADAAGKFLDRIVPGLEAVVKQDRPRIKIWPAQLSHQGFGAYFHRSMLTSEREGNPSNWALIAGRAKVGGQPVLVGLGLWTDEPNSIGRVTLEPHQWRDVLRLRTV